MKGTEIFIKIHKGEMKEVRLQGFESADGPKEKIYSYGLNQFILDQISTDPSSTNVRNILNKFQEEFDPFLLVIVDELQNIITIYNDHFGSNEIYYAEKAQTQIISQHVKDIFRYFSISPLIRTNSVYEHIAFQNILPPETIFENVHTLKMAASLHARNGQFEVSEFWDVDTLLNDKTFNYGELVEKSRKALLESLKNIMPEKTAVALSGGIDSGGLLGMVTSIKGGGVPSISMGGHGPTSTDLNSARRSAIFNNSPNIEIYPDPMFIKELPKLYKDLSQPVLADIIYSYSMIHRKAHEINMEGVVYGFGAEMLLGNLKVAQIGYYIKWIEKLLPPFILKPLYKISSHVFGLSKTQTEFLLSFSWEERFMYTRGALFSWERDYFTGDIKSFWLEIKGKISNTMAPTNMNLGDRLTKAYLFNWVNYQQWREFKIIGSKYNILPVIPFDTARLVKHFFRATDQIRRKNRWGKMLIRDAMRPYVSDHLYSNPVRSLIIPYNKMLAGKEVQIIDYLRHNTALKNKFDFQKIKREWKSMPEPGLFLFRLLGVAIWYDVNFEPERVKEFEKIFE